jgi:hypothetical protein
MLRAVMRLVTIAAAIATGAIVGSACLIDLDHRIACGDGYHDPIAGEECDPGDPDSFENACEGTNRPQGTAACDPKTCQIIKDRLQCAYCGDGVLDDDFIMVDGMTVRLEECEGNNIPKLCPTSGPVGCSDCRLDFSKCDKCGNGEVETELGEECDPEVIGGIAIPRPCAGDGEFQPLDTPYQDYPYTSGYTARCLSDCTFDRQDCGYCGNGVADGAREIAISPEQNVRMSDPEECDGHDPNDVAIEQAFPQCDGDFVTANVGCSDECEFMPRGGPTCCLETAAPCPDEDDPARCCHEYSSPDAEQHCSNPFLPPGSEEPPEDGGAKCN